ncbi:hypothetical protein Syun_030446 [Stephania yunnanensis]|uniref:Uncharacterized protein n=1 Tax=Stephania yunnanensis TaxID=152371 RepID=A0AAP0EC00_9MAGN
MNAETKTPKPSKSETSLKDQIFIPALIAGVIGGSAGLVSKHRKTHGLANISAAYAANSAIVAGCYYGVREFVRSSRGSEPNDLIDSAIGGFSTGAILGRLQGGQIGAVKYSVIFAIAGTVVDYATLQVKHRWQGDQESISGGSESSKDKSGWLRLPEWSPIQVLDEEALAAKRAREEQLYAQSTLANLNKKEP